MICKIATHVHVQLLGGVVLGGYKKVNQYTTAYILVKTQAAQAQDVNKLFNTDTVKQHMISRDCMGN